MKPLFYTAAAVLCFGLTACKEEAPSTADSLMRKSPGGLDYALIALPEADDVVLQVAWPTDWALREGVNQAVPYIGTDLILAGGAEGFPAGDVVELFSDMQATGRLVVSADVLSGTVAAPKDNFAKTVEIANAHLRAPSLDDAWLTRIRDDLASTINEGLALPAVQGFDALRWSVLGETPLRRSLSLDTAGMIEGTTRDEVIAWQMDTIVRKGALIAIAGPIEEAKAGEMVDALFAGLPEGHALSATKPAPNFAPKRILLHAPLAETSTLSFVAPLPPFSEGFELEDIIIATELGGDDQSLLFKAMRTDLRASYEFGSYLDAFTNKDRILVLTGEVETAKLAEAEKVVLAAYETLLTKGVERDLASTKEIFTAGSEETRADPYAASNTAVMGLLERNDPSYGLNLQKVIGDLSPASVAKRLETSWPKKDGFVMIAVSPDENALPGACVIKSAKEALGCN